MSPRGVPGTSIGTCHGCLAWGCAFDYGWCRACSEFARRWEVGECGACDRRLPVKKGHCRLCWCQARLDRVAELGGTGTYYLLLPYARGVRHQQLFLAGLPAPRDLHPKPAVPLRGVGSGAKGVKRKPAPPAAGKPPCEWVQPPLIEDVPRHYHRLVDLRSHPELDNPWLQWALHLAHDLAERRGFQEPVAGAVNRALVMLLARHNPGEMIRLSDFDRVLLKRGNTAEHTAHVLANMGVLFDDRPKAFDAWIDGKLVNLAPAISRDAEQWARTLRFGGPRSKTRTEATVRNYIRVLGPPLHTWSQRYAHLREVRREDVLHALAPLRGQPRQTTLAALRSLFRWAKQHGVVFRNPTTRVRAGPLERLIPQPLTPEQIAPTVAAATGPHARLAVVLAAVHAARHGEIITMRLGDVDLGERRLSVAGRSRPMDELTHQVLCQWLEHRRDRWPNTPNPHLLISKESALRLGPVTRPWLGRLLRGLPATLERLRIDRHLDEALVSGGDPLHVAEVFGLSDTTAIRYADAARQLLQEGAARVHREPPDSR